MGSDVEVKKVVTTKMMKEFILLPWRLKIYQNDPVWVPPLISEQKKLFNKKTGYFFEIGDADFFLAYREGKPVGRITAHTNNLYEEKYDNETGFFGFYESINDVEVAKALFQTAENRLKQKNKRLMQGPQSFSIYDSVGFETEGKDSIPSVGLLHFAPYYEDLAISCGFTKCIDWHCFCVKKADEYKPYLQQVRNEFLKNSDVIFKPLDKNNIESRVDDIFYIFNTAWEGNWGHLPLTRRQFDVLIKELKPFIIPELVYFAEKDGKTIGFIISVPDINPSLRILNGRLYPWRLLRFFREVKKVKRLRTIIMGVLPEYRHQRIHDIFFLFTVEHGINLGFTESDCSLIVETNKRMINALKRLNAEKYKTYRIYQKQIPDPKFP